MPEKTVQFVNKISAINNNKLIIHSFIHSFIPFNSGSKAHKQQE